MIYLCYIKNEQYICDHIFQNENEFAAWLTRLGNYEDILHRQRLTDTDICRYREEYWNNVIELDRDIRLLDEHGRILDVRDYQHLIPGDTRIYNKWLDRTYLQPQRKKIKPAAGKSTS